MWEYGGMGEFLFAQHPISPSLYLILASSIPGFLILNPSVLSVDFSASVF